VDSGQGGIDNKVPALYPLGLNSGTVASVNAEGRAGTFLPLIEEKKLSFICIWLPAAAVTGTTLSLSGII
jgi:hypothetical protein